jgi:hypothetical protein
LARRHRRSRLVFITAIWQAQVEQLFAAVAGVSQAGDTAG